MSQPVTPAAKGNRRLWIAAITTIAILLLVSLGAVVYWWAFVMREHDYWTETAKLWDGRSITLRLHSSHKAYHGAVGHFSPYWWGGGDERGNLQFTIDEEEYRWEGPYIPIAIQQDRDHTVYLIVYDRESEEARWPKIHPIGGYYFRIYKSNAANSWDEIGPKELPRHLAIQNAWHCQMQSFLLMFLESQK